MSDNRDFESRFLDDVREFDMMLSITGPLLYDLLARLDSAAAERSKNGHETGPVTLFLPPRITDQINFALHNLLERSESLAERARLRMHHLDFGDPDPYRQESILT